MTSKLSIPEITNLRVDSAAQKKLFYTKVKSENVPPWTQHPVIISQHLLSGAQQRSEDWTSGYTSNIYSASIQTEKEANFSQHLLRSRNAVKHCACTPAWIFKADSTVQPFSICTANLPGVSLALATWCHRTDIVFVSLVGCGKSSGADLLGVESEPWVFKGGVSGEVQVGCVFI